MRIIALILLLLFGMKHLQAFRCIATSHRNVHEMIGCRQVGYNVKWERQFLKALNVTRPQTNKPQCRQTARCKLS